MRKEIIKKSYELFMDKGFEKVSVNEIIQALDISKGGFYHHFNSKDDLLEEIALIHSKKMITELEKVDISKFASLSELINNYYQVLIKKKTEETIKRIQMEEKLSAKDNIKLLVKIKKKIDKVTIEFFTDIFTQYSIEHPLEIAQTWLESNYRLNKLLYKLISGEINISEDELKNKLKFYEDLFSYLFSDQGSIRLVEPIMEYVKSAQAILEAKKDD